MELKRILARDTRSATDQAIALYGPDVLVISNHQVNGQTELVVAIELVAEDDDMTLSAATPAPASTPAPAATFTLAAKPATPMAATEPLAAPVLAAPFASQVLAVHTPALDMALGASVNAPVKALATPAAAEDFHHTLTQVQQRPAALSASTEQEDARDYLRSREIVDMVRDELAALRREFRLSQQTASWQSGLNMPSGVAPLVQALSEAGVPNGLRTLLVDTLKDIDNAADGIEALRAQLTHTLKRKAVALPTKGVHLLAGPSGSGKSLMIARLARHTEQTHGAEQVAVISYQDMRAGAWSQTQMLGAQLGVECFRANDAQTLRLLIDELSHRRLVLIDTAGVQMNERVAEVLAVNPACHCHAVMPADASSVTLRRVLTTGDVPWKSLMLSKLDESSQPWALLQFLSDNAIGLSGASDGGRTTDLIHNFSLPQLVDLALAPLQLTPSDNSLTIEPASLEGQNAPELSTVQVLKQRKTATRKRAA
jgi:flagellar biosynthesis GTPase FlhF